MTVSPPPSDADPRFIDGYLAYLLARASQLISGEFHATLKAEGIPVNEWRVLAALADGPKSVTELAGIILEQQPTASRIISRMEKSGLVTRQADPADRRVIRIHLTEAARARATPLIDQAHRHQIEALAPFGEQRAKDFLAILRELIHLHEKQP